MKRGALKYYRFFSLVTVVSFILAEYLIYYLCYFLYVPYTVNAKWRVVSMIVITALTLLVILSFITLWNSRPKTYSHKNKLKSTDEEKRDEIIEYTAENKRTIKYLQRLISNNHKRIDENNNSSFSRYRCLDNKTLKAEIQKLKAISYDKNTWCFDCNHVKPLQVHHCRRCGVCIEQLDHHCYVIGRCIGQGNIKDFVRCIIYIALTSFLIVFNEAFFYFGKIGIKGMNYNVFTLLLLFNSATCMFFLSISLLFMYYMTRSYLLGVSGLEGRNKYFIANKTAKHSIKDLINEIISRVL